MIFQGKKILIAICGGIAAYKINLLIRDFIKAGANVQLIMTQDAEKFVSKVTLSTLSKNPVYSNFYDQNGTWHNHVELALNADVFLIAPCTANTLGKMVHGISDNLVLATYLSAKCPVFIAPAMDLDMYAHPSTQQNLAMAEDFGNIIIPAESGELASGLNGLGRMAEPETIFKFVESYFHTFNNEKTLSDKTVLITAGPTYEALDPVRFIGNHSSGKMGFAIAEEAANRGANVIVISGPTQCVATNENIKTINVVSAKEMYGEVFKYYKNVNIAIATAAVADYAPKEIADEKIKKNEDSFTLELIKNPDILLEMGHQKKGQFLVGFALETENEEANAKGKLKKKNLNMIVLNSLKDSGAGFKGDTNKIKIFTENEIKEFGLKTKKEVAKDILDSIEAALK